MYTARGLKCGKIQVTLIKSVCIFLAHKPPYPIEIPQCFPARLKPSAATDRPISMIVGATVKGPIKRKRTLTKPVAPIIISIMAATMIDPVN